MKNRVIAAVVRKPPANASSFELVVKRKRAKEDSTALAILGNQGWFANHPWFCVTTCDAGNGYDGAGRG